MLRIALEWLYGLAKPWIGMCGIVWADGSVLGLVLHVRSRQYCNAERVSVLEVDGCRGTDWGSWPWKGTYRQTGVVRDGN